MKSGLVRGFLSVGIWTFVSRVSGFVRDILMAAWLGTVVVATVLSQELALSQATRISRVAAASSAAVDAVQLAAGLIQTTNETFGTGGMALNDDAVAAQSWRDALHQGLPQRIDKLRRVTYRAFIGAGGQQSKILQ